MSKKPFTYFKFTTNKPNYAIALSWFNHFRKKNMAAVLVRVNQKKNIFNDVWVECDPVFYGDHDIPKASRKRAIAGEIVLSCGGFRERFDPQTKELAPRMDYTSCHKCPACSSTNIYLGRDIESGFTLNLKCMKCGFILESKVSV